ncbi:aminoglycoside phosphotransferase [Paenibacillus sp. PK3_47]|uniref:phosphotransferase enzyme family protein n=1 Tax=Paenibacillus sp. PK3_47 TaxID=2072642 RepID=UPI00201D3B5E|nr:phosphotransferase [Paenibacillus sp. PK3_47]UQZ36906.1 aminoglycoside phosphotransferase [Paenibacillus sp. PK3_47]
MTNNEAAKIIETNFLTVICGLFGLEGYEFARIKPHAEGRNIVYNCEKTGADPKIIRIAFLNDRSREDLLAEIEYMRYLFGNDGSVPEIFRSKQGNLLEEIRHHHQSFYVCLFAKAIGNTFADNHYQYREGADITEYYYNCGKTLGKLHQLSKEYTPAHRRYDFFDIYNTRTLETLLPGSFPLLKEKLQALIKSLEGLERSRETYGMIHLDYNDGNYMIDFDTGRITVYDFDNSCFGWYMYDLADLWRNGTGWIAGEPDADKRRSFMADYFKTALEGYKSETGIEETALQNLPLFINVLLMEQILDQFEYVRRNGEEYECDEELSYYIKCLEDGIPYMGFFHDIYSCEEPFEYEA